MHSTTAGSTLLAFALALALLVPTPPVAADWAVRYSYSDDFGRDHHHRRHHDRGRSAFIIHYDSEPRWRDRRHGYHSRQGCRVVTEYWGGRHGHRYSRVTEYCGGGRKGYRAGGHAVSPRVR